MSRRIASYIYNTIFPPQIPLPPNDLDFKYVISMFLVYQGSKYCFNPIGADADDLVSIRQYAKTLKLKQVENLYYNNSTTVFKKSEFGTLFCNQSSVIDDMFAIFPTYEITILLGDFVVLSEYCLANELKHDLLIKKSTEKMTAWESVLEHYGYSLPPQLFVDYKFGLEERYKDLLNNNVTVYNTYWPIYVRDVLFFYEDEEFEFGRPDSGVISSRPGTPAQFRKPIFDSFRTQYLNLLGPIIQNLTNELKK